MRRYRSPPLAITFKELDYASKFGETLLFTHWPIPTEILRPHIPSTLELDTYNGSAWLGVVVFVIWGEYQPSWIVIDNNLNAYILEINVKTYVHYEGKPGVFFMSLDVGDWASYTIAKRWWTGCHNKKASISFQKKRDKPFIVKVCS